MRATTATLFLALSMGLAGVANATTGSNESSTGTKTTSAAAGQTSLTSGEVRKVDLEQGKITLKHERIESLDMPPMTMVFKAADPQLLKNVKAGDKVQFRAESTGGAIVVTELRTAS
jgi:Cu(I)/Ag(I) efflux system protein CusF